MAEKNKNLKHLLRKRLWSCKYGFKGIGTGIRTQINLRIHIFAAIAVTILGIWLKISYFEWVAVIMVCGMVIAAELINTAIEELTNLVSPEYHKKAELIKDVSAGAVLILAIAAVIIGIMIFYPRLL